MERRAVDHDLPRVVLVFDYNILGLMKYIRRSRARFLPHVKLVSCVKICGSGCNDECLAEYVLSRENTYLVTLDRLLALKCGSKGIYLPTDKNAKYFYRRAWTYILKKIRDVGGSN